nr:ribonuclease H-like domain-containing protein [Tanacetum cinerariifolium]
MDIEIEQYDLNQKFLTSLAPEWLMHIIVWRNKSDLDTMSLDDLYNHLKVYESKVQKKSESNSQNMAFISSAKNSIGKEEVNTASIPTAGTNVSPASVNIGAVSIRKKISIQGTDVAGFDKSKAPKALMAIDEVGWDWSFMANEEEDHALVVDEETPIEFALMAKTNDDSEVFDNSLCSKTCKKNTDSLNSKITELTDKLSDTKNTVYHYKLGLSQVESRLVEFKNQEVKYCEKIRGLEFKVEARANRIECFTNELELLKKEKEGLESKLIGFQSASKDIDRLSEFADDTITDYSRPSPAIESTSDDVQKRNPSVTETEASTSIISSKPFI